MDEQTPRTSPAEQNEAPPARREPIPPIDKGGEALYICLLMPLGVVVVVGIAYLIFYVLRH